jgi:hypothetical protein
MRTLFPQQDRGLLHDLGVSFLLVFPGIAHVDLMECLQSYNTPPGRKKLHQFALLRLPRPNNAMGRPHAGVF